LTQRLRNNGCTEVWTLEDVEKIVEDNHITDDKHVRLEKIDPDMPWDPSNVQVIQRKRYRGLV
jgi:hypothetical protein